MPAHGALTGYGNSQAPGRHAEVLGSGRGPFWEGEGAFCRLYIPPPLTLDGGRERDMSRDTWQDGKHVKIRFGRGSARLTLCVCSINSTQIRSHVFREEKEMVLEQSILPANSFNSKICVRERA